MRKFSADKEEEDAYKNRTLRFTNNNFVGTTAIVSMNPVVQKEESKKEEHEVDLYESIEEEILVSQQGTPYRDKRKGFGLPPRQSQFTQSNKGPHPLNHKKGEQAADDLVI